MSRNFFDKPFLLLFITLINACAAPPKAVERGEMLVQKMPLPSGEWEAERFPSAEMNVLETRWTSTTSNDIAQTFVYYDSPNVDITQLKRDDDTLGVQACESGFSSKVLSAADQNGYPQITWRSLCQPVAGATVLVLHKAISGNEAQYTFRRTFASIPNKEEWLMWLSYLSHFSVCDSTKPNKHPCLPQTEQIKKD
ncbi:hypothetical protein [Alteromonas sp. ASW11-130]|uniref:hypothetical protein n=1 Tax=Alteromonas sp. ASW11-130 TaxID=3015775 RepID=UPI002241C623|nr:hypothetical protein [Alteromonas sp. ASW11-130]MCW8093341.1 hypothetical protein [Alteromonas sp. ASW11-130]